MLLLRLAAIAMEPRPKSGLIPVVSSLSGANLRVEVGRVVLCHSLKPRVQYNSGGLVWLLPNLWKYMLWESPESFSAPSGAFLVVAALAVAALVGRGGREGLRWGNPARALLLQRARLELVQAG